MQKILAILSLTLLCGASSYAIDQVVLSTGEIVEGKVLADVPNRHVDIQLVNGEKRRYPKSQVANVERDVPSNKDRSTFIGDKRIFFGPLLGGMISTSGGEMIFTYGLKFGFNASLMSSSKFAPALAFKRISDSVGSISASITNIETQFLFREMGNTGFYLGPQIGLGILSASSGSSSGSATSFLGGFVLGYDIFVNEGFSIGPDVQFDHYFASGWGLNTISFALSALFHFD